MRIQRTDYLFWVGACAAAELLGIAAGATWWVMMDQLDPEPATIIGKFVSLSLKALSGLAEGVVLGGLQGLALRRVYPTLSVGRWVVATSVLAVGGWALGSAIPIFGRFEAAGPGAEPPLATTVALAALFGLAVGALFGAAQAAVLKGAARRTRWWVAFNALGWAGALPIIYVAASAGDTAAGLGGVVFRGLTSGLAAGLTLGAVTGLAFRFMRPRRAAW